MNKLKLHCLRCECKYYNPLLCCTLSGVKIDDPNTCSYFKYRVKEGETNIDKHYLFKIDVNEILKAKHSCRSPKYLIVNRETSELIKNEVGYYVDQSCSNKNVVHIIYDLIIAISENLKFGEFEVR